MQQLPPTGIVTLMFTDIVGSTMLRDALVAEHGESEGNDRYRSRILAPHNERIRGLLAKHRGFEVKTIGDAFLAAFAKPEDAVSCAVEIQRSLRAEPIAANGGALEVRIGIHTGQADYVERDGKPDYDGHAVNIAARVESLLKGGSRVYCSGETKALAKTAPGLRFHSYGAYPLKGVSARVEIFDVLWHDALQPAPPEQPHETLPYPWLTPWVGREREMDELTAALQANRLVTLHGPGGVGKTRMAVETLLARGAGLPREIVFVPLAPAADTEAGFLAAVREALALNEAEAPDLDALCRRLHGGDRLLLLDNFESVRSAALSVPRLATTPGTRVLVTSQHALGLPGECVVELDPMETTVKAKGDLAALESHRLFVTLARQRDARWQPDDDAAMRGVLAATDGLPYLIELVAAVAHKRRLAQLAEEIGIVRSRFAGRHASVEACLTWALERLPEMEREALPRLAAFAGGFDAEAAEQVAATAIGSLDVLVDASLLRFDRDAGRYSMLPTTQEFLRRRLGEEERTRLAAALARWFIERLERANRTLRARGGETQRAARRWIDAEYENVRQAVAHAEEREPELFRRAVFAFAEYLSQTYRFSERVRLQEALLDRIDPAADPQAWATTQNNLGIAYWNLPAGDRAGNLAKAIACFEAALHVRTERDFPKEWAMTQNNLGIAYMDLPAGDRPENLAKAIACYEAALKVWTERDFPTEWAATQNNLGIAYLPAGDQAENVAKAIACFEAALRVRTERDFPTRWATTQNNLGAAYRNLPAGDRAGTLAKAIACYQAALRIRTEQAFPKEWAETQYNLGLVYEELANGEPGDLCQQAIVCFESAARGVPGCRPRG